MDALFADEATPVADRMRMAASLGVIAGVLAGRPGGNVFWGLPPDELRSMLVGMIDDVLKVG